MAFMLLEDYTSKAEIVIFPKLFSQIESWLSQYQVFLVKGIIDLTGSKMLKIKAQSCIPADLLFEQWAAEKLSITLPQIINQDSLVRVKSKLVPGSTSCELYFEENGKNLRLRSKNKIRLNDDLLKTLESEGIETEIKI